MKRLARVRLPAPFEPSLRVRLVLLGPSLPECDAIGFYIRARIAVLNSDSGSMHTPTGMALHGSRPAFWLDSFPGQKRGDLRLARAGNTHRECAALAYRPTSGRLYRAR